MSNDDRSDRKQPPEDADGAQDERLGREVGQMRPEDKKGNTDQQRQGPYNTLRLGIEALALIIVAVGTSVAWHTLEAIQASVDAMNVQIKADRNALWLDQRPWLGVSTAEVVGGFEVGGKPTIRLSLVNSGKTPALNVKLLERVSLTRTLDNNDIHDWEAPNEFFPSIHYRSAVAFPNGTLHQDIAWPFPMNETQFAQYTNSELDVTIWSRIEYCSPDQSFHWTEIGISKTFAEDELLIRRSSVSAHPGVTDDPDCQPAGDLQ